uniref:G_PROTEIN_RECEP_F1_2 domain-containing protein n=1 Tax=Rhabditophanes sp. KR3021 TaxID=114890 RepID=A0AC35TNY8_9BILA
MELEPPQPILSDYIEICMLIGMFILGGPINLAAYSKNHFQNFEKDYVTRLDVLKRHLNLSDLLILFIYVPSRTCWLLTYDFRGGNLLCKLLKYSHTFSFQISSNVIVVIAIDRLLSIISPINLSSNEAIKRTKKMLVVAWLLAGISSLPQLFVWQEHLAYEKEHWCQCLTRWEIRKMDILKMNTSLVNEDIVKEFEYLTWSENAYLIFHVLATFWIPISVICICYLFVSSWLYFNTKPLNIYVGSGCSVKTQSTKLSSSGDGGLSKALLPSKKVSERKESISYPANEENTNSYSDTSTVDSTRNFKTSKKNKQKSHSDAYKNIEVGRTIFNSSTYRDTITRSKTMKVSFLLITAYFICWLPYNIMSLIRFAYPYHFSNYAIQFHCLYGLIVLNSVINPFLYGLFNNNVTSITKLFRSCL